MPYLEGVGDEVLITVAVVVVVLASLLLWSLTETSTGSPVNQSTPTHRTVQIPSPEPRTIPRREVDSNPSPQHSGPNEVPTELQTNASQESTERHVRVENLSVHESVQGSDSGPDCDEESSDIRQRRLDFFNKNSTEDECAPCSRNSVDAVSNGPTGNHVVDAQPGGAEAGSSTSEPRTIQIRLKYLNDTERNVQSPPSQTIQQFKRIHFADDLANNRLVRLISTGYILEDSRTLQSYELMDNSVIHVQIQTTQVNTQRPSNEAESELDIGQFLSPILGVALLCVWIMHFQYKDYFSTTSMVALLVLSVLFVTVVWGQHGSSRTVNPPVQ